MQCCSAQCGHLCQIGSGNISLMISGAAVLQCCSGHLSCTTLHNSLLSLVLSPLTVTGHTTRRRSLSKSFVLEFVDATVFGVGWKYSSTVTPNWFYCAPTFPKFYSPARVLLMLSGYLSSSHNNTTVWGGVARWGGGGLQTEKTIIVKLSRGMCDTSTSSLSGTFTKVFVAAARVSY